VTVSGPFRGYGLDAAKETSHEYYPSTQEKSNQVVYEKDDL
jgi:hypothetical protein